MLCPPAVPKPCSEGGLLRAREGKNQHRRVLLGETNSRASVNSKREKNQDEERRLLLIGRHMPCSQGVSTSIVHTRRLHSVLLPGVCARIRALDCGQRPAHVRSHS